MLRVTIWNEYIHEQQNPLVQAIYPNGIHGCLEEFLSRNQDMKVQSVTFHMPEHGLTEKVLQETDVLIWWGHIDHDGVSDQVVARVKEQILQGMGLIALHSAHHSKIMKVLLGTSLNLKWKHGDQERLICIHPGHPITAGVTDPIDLEEEEMYGEYFDIPVPDELIYLGWFASGQVFRSACVFHRGRGKIFYFQPGHEEYPIYHHPKIQQILTNGVRYVAPVNYLKEPYPCEPM